jgi:rhodanese-related sulfurtransferase
LLNGLRPLSVAEFEISADLNNAIILDTREPAIFYKGFIPRSINIGIKGDFAPWVGAIIKDVKQPILLVTQTGLEEETITRLSRVGFDHVLGYLNGSFVAWQLSNKEIDTVNRITASQFAAEVDLKTDSIIDVRKESEYNLDHVNEAFNMPLDQINDWFAKLNSNKTLFIHCAGGYRSMIAASIFKLRGFHQFKEIEGGFKAITEVADIKPNFISH